MNAEFLGEDEDILVIEKTSAIHNSLWSIQRSKIISTCKIRDKKWPNQGAML